MSINSLASHENISEFIDNAINDIYDQKIWVQKELLEISEVTYTYDEETNINTRLFCIVGELNLTEYKKNTSFDIRETLFHTAYTKTKNILLNKVSQISSTIEQLEKQNINGLDRRNQLLIDLFNKALVEKKKLLQYAILALPLEKEKAGFNHQLSSEEYLQLNNQIHALDIELFGGDIKNHPDEVEKLYSAYREKYLNNQDKLSHEEQKKMGIYFGLVEKYLPKGYEYSQPQTAKKIHNSFLQKKISRNEYIPLFNEVLKGLKDSDHTAQVNKNVNTVCDTQEGIDFPNSENFDNLTLERILTLMNHECEAHCISDHNSQAIMGKIRGAGSTKKDEGVAVFMEQILLYGNEIYTQKDGKTIIDPSKISVNPAYIQILMCEVLNNDQLLDFLNLSHKIIGGNISPKARYNRLKRNNAIHGQHKDVLYLRGLFQAIDEINKYILTDGVEGISMEDMFMGKVSFEDTPIFKELREITLKKEADTGNIYELLQPKFIAETILYLLQSNLVTSDGKISKEFSQINFLEYLQNKYPIANLSEEIFNQITYTTKRSLYKVLNILNKYDNNEKK